MSKEDKFKIPEKYKKWLDLKMWALVGIIAKIAWDTFTTGAEVKYQAHFQESLKTDGAKEIRKAEMLKTIDEAIDDANMWHKLSASPHFLKEVYKYKAQIADEILKADSSKIDFVGGIAVGAELRDEAIMPILIKLVKAIDNGELMLKADVEKYIEKEVKRRTARSVRADF